MTRRGGGGGGVVVVVGGPTELDHAELVGRTVVALRGFGEFEVRWGLCAYGKELTA